MVWLITWLFPVYYCVVELIMKVKWILLLLVTAVVFLGACTQKDSKSLTPIVFSPQPKINESRAIAIASHYVPIEIVIRSEIISSQSSISTDRGIINDWSIAFNTAHATRAQLEASGWLAGADTIFDGDSPYRMVAIAIDANSGDVLQKTASNAFLGQIATEVPISAEEAKIITSRYVPYGVVVRARIESVANLDLATSKQTWLVYYIVNVSQKDLDWHESNNTHLDKLNPGENYFELVIKIDKNSGDLVRRAAFVLPQATPLPASSNSSDENSFE